MNWRSDCFGTPAIGLPSIATLAANYVALKYGFLIHFNMYTYSQTHAANQPINTFAPTTNNFIAQWVSTAQSASCGYCGITAKHIDGFCIWNTASTAYNVTQTSWYQTGGGFDIVGQFCSQMRAAGIVPVLYFSLPDNTYSGGFSGSSLSYLDYTRLQISELLTNYGAIAGLWTDASYGTNPNPFASDADRNSFIHSQQYACLDLPNRHIYDKNLLGDILVFEAQQPNAKVQLSGSTLSGGNATTAATGFINFHDNNPVPGNTVTLGGTVVTFVASGAVGNQSNIGSNESGTLTNLAAMLNASSDPNLSLCTYASTSFNLNITYGTVGTVGNSFTLAENISGPYPGEMAETDFNPQTLWFWHPSYALQSAATLENDKTVSHNRNATYTNGVGPDQTGVIPSDQATLLITVGNH